MNNSRDDNAREAENDIPWNSIYSYWLCCWPSTDDCKNRWPVVAGPEDGLFHEMMSLSTSTSSSYKLPEKFPEN